jgi:hypothetical protein
MPAFVIMASVYSVSVLFTWLRRQLPFGQPSLSVVVSVLSGKVLRQPHGRWGYVQVYLLGKGVVIIPLAMEVVCHIHIVVLW